MKFIKMYQDRYELWAYPRVAQGFLLDPLVSECRCHYDRMVGSDFRYR